MGYISTGGDQFVTIADAELQHTQAYMDLMCVRFADELNFSCAVPLPCWTCSDSLS